MKSNPLLRASMLLVPLTLACGPESKDPIALDPNGKPVAFVWTFNGMSCAQRPDISSVYLKINNQQLENSGSFPCSANGMDGVVLTRFSPGYYSYTLSAPTPNGPYHASDSFQVAGSGQLIRGDLR